MYLTKSANPHLALKGRLLFQSPIKFSHVWIPLTFLIACLYQNQAVALLSLPEVALGFAIALLSCLPLFVWASRNVREIPAFQCFCLIHFPYYAYPILSGKPQYLKYPEIDRLTAAAIVAVFLAIANAIYYLGLRKDRSSSPSSVLANRELSEERVRVLCTLLLSLWVSFNIVIHFGLLPFHSGLNILYTLATGSGFVGLWSLARQLGEKRLSTAHAIYIVSAVVFGVLVNMATGSLIGGLMMLVVGFVAYTIGLGRIPWVLIAISLGFIAFLNLGKGEMRSAFWRRGAPPVLTVPKIYEIYAYWIPQSWHRLWDTERRSAEQNSLLDRANLIHMLVLVTNRTPEPLPYLWGETYAYVPQLLVPRVIWKDKPAGNIATTKLGYYYGIVERHGERRTTIAFGLLPEAWANFGWFGIIGLAIVQAIAMCAVANACLGATPYSIHSILGIVWIALAFQIELCFSQWFTVLLQFVSMMFMIMYPFTRPMVRTITTAGETPSYSSW